MESGCQLVAETTASEAKDVGDINEWHAEWQKDGPRNSSLRIRRGRREGGRKRYSCKLPRVAVGLFEESPV